MKFLIGFFRSLIILLALLTAFHLYANDHAHAQDLDNVVIVGRVADQNGASLYGASVTAKLLNTNAERTVITDAEGRYRIIGLEPGAYAVRASFKNFATEERMNLITVAGE